LTACSRSMRRGARHFNWDSHLWGVVPNGINNLDLLWGPKHSGQSFGMMPVYRSSEATDACTVMLVGLCMRADASSTTDTTAW